MTSRSELITKLQQLRTDSKEDIKKTASLALAALELNPKAESLQGLIQNKLNNFISGDTINPLNSTQLQDAVKTWLGSDLISEGSLTIGQPIKDNKLEGTVDTNLLNRLSNTIVSCIEGKLSNEVCKNNLETYNDSIRETKQMVNLKLAVTTLKTLGFKINKKSPLLVAGTTPLPQVQSVENWIKDNKSSLPTIGEGEDKKIVLNQKLIAILETLVLTANAYAQDWEKENLVPAKFSSRKTSTNEKKNEIPIILGIMTQMDGFTSYQKYLSGLLPIKAKKLGILDFNLFGGSGLQRIDRDSTGNVTGGLYLSYVDEQVDTRKGFLTADTLKTFFDKYINIFNKKNIKISDTEITQMKENLEKLKKDEVDLANITKIIEQYLALKKYLGVDDKGETMKEISDILTKHSDKLQKVDKRRKGLGNVLYVMAQQIDTVIV